jgi:hypothetical protein
MYYQCLMVFPSLYNRLTSWRSCTKKYLLILIGLLVLNTIILVTTWFVSKDYRGYNHYDEFTGTKTSMELREDASKHNAGVLAWYLFSPFWIIYFAIGAVSAFLYDAFRPTEKTRVWCWGYVADTCSLFIILWSICLVRNTIFNFIFQLRTQKSTNNAIIIVTLTYRFRKETSHMTMMQNFLSVLMKQITTLTQL